MLLLLFIVDAVAWRPGR